EAVVVLLANRDPAGLEHAPRAGGETQQARDVVVVLHRSLHAARGPRMPGGRSGRAGALGDEDGGVGDDRVDLAEQVTGQVDAVRRQVAEHAGAASLPFITPGESAVR